jgi:AAA domain (Cdc48 subfamily)
MRSNKIDQGLAQNIVLAAQAASTVLLIGDRQFDHFVATGPDGKEKIVGLESLCSQALQADAIWLYEPVHGEVRLHSIKPNRIAGTSLPVDTGEAMKLSLVESLAALEGVVLASSAQDEQPYSKLALLVDAGLLMDRPNAPYDQFFAMTQAIERFGRTADRSRILLLRAANVTAIPIAVSKASFCRTINLKLASRDERMAYARMRSAKLAAAFCVDVEDIARSIAATTEGWALNTIDSLIESAFQQDFKSVIDLEELANAFRLGAATSPWAGDEIRHAVSSAKSTLERRVIGQTSAMAATALVLQKAVVGLSGAHQSRYSDAPKFLLFNAGPTGTGKTESAKAVAEIVFGSEAIVRIDCAGLAEKHAIQRLTGSPPGYLGHDQGGELTNAVLAKPNSVVLFDECEKAHPAFWNIFLSIADDGRLTSGKGEICHFSQAGIILTSNLGMYEKKIDADGREVIQARFDYQTPFDEIEREVREAVKDFFLSKLGKPEILGRFGGHANIVVFDFLRDMTGVANKFIHNLREKCMRLHSIDLSVSADLVEHVVQQTKSDTDALVLGGRGLAAKLEIALVNPLAQHLFESNARNCAIHASLAGGEVRFLLSRKKLTPPRQRRWIAPPFPEAPTVERMEP